MKLRLEKEKITIRLKPSEIKKFSDVKFLEEKLSLSENNHFTFALSISEFHNSLDAEFIKSSLLVHVPQQKVDKWIKSNQVGMKETIVSEFGSEIILTLEEDLPPRKDKKKT